MFVLTIDQRRSRTSTDKVPALLDALKNIPTVRAFQRTAGDEIQGILDQPSAVLDTLETATRLGDWYVGIGIGPVNQPLPKNARESSGPALINARAAVDRAKKKGNTLRFALEADGDASTSARRAESALALWVRLLAERGTRDWEYVDALENYDGARQPVAKRFGLSAQAVSSAAQRAGFDEARNARDALGFLLGLTDETANQEDSAS